MIRFLYTLATALIGGWVFTLIHSPLPWLLGPMSFVFLGARAFKLFQPNWPEYLRNTAMILIGYSFGLSFTSETLAEMGKQLPTMVLMTVLLMLMCAFIAFVVSKLTGEPLPTVLLGCIPGGLSQMLVLAEDTKGIDLTTVMFLQLSRTMINIVAVPLLIFSPLFGGTHSTVPTGASIGASSAWNALFPDIVPLMAVCIVAAFLAQKIRFPTAFLLGPMIAVAALQLSGVHGPALPSSVLNVAQLLIGSYIGLLLRPESLAHKKKMVGFAILSGIVIVTGSLGLSALLRSLHPLSASTSFLSLAPGGLDQMGLIAKEIHADMAIVSCYQVFRIWFIFFAITPLMKLAIKRLLPLSDAKSSNAKKSV
ncbi:AbrB family transcriptional regulator [Cohnella terricola]|uniref:AbrB family transcriptional regulator n=1 Tax=Cohnella terricola TaxID=1289167 RepID=A0A559JQ48_9BACL|nr:AbrB family transcriptional regulator [Cohnella terricola]TVY02016.1 AbrB family transcriptional regulator [Cohnella terricola]